MAPRNLPSLDEIVSSGNWNALLTYDAGTQADKEPEDERPSDALLASGVAVVPGKLSDEETSALASEFRLLRGQFERTHRQL